jgi:hypothetical protein
MLSRKEVLTISINASLEIRNAREAGSTQAVLIALLFRNRPIYGVSCTSRRFKPSVKHRQKLLIAVSLTERASRKVVQWESKVTGSGRLWIGYTLRQAAAHAEATLAAAFDQGDWKSWSARTNH